MESGSRLPQSMFICFEHHGGSAGPLRHGKFSTFEGGQRVPSIMWAPGRIPAGTVCDEFASTIDLLPSIAAITGTPLAADRAIDGIDISSLLTGTAKSVRNVQHGRLHRRDPRRG